MKLHFNLKQISYYAYDQKLRTTRGGATVLKVGGTISRAERAKKIFGPPTLRLPGRYKNDYLCTKFAHRNGIMILKKSEKSFVKVIVMTDDVVLCSFVSLHQLVL